MHQHALRYAPALTTRTHYGIAGITSHPALRWPQSKAVNGRHGNDYGVPAVVKSCTIQRVPLSAPKTVSNTT